jgi:hypothetical protein
MKIQKINEAAHNHILISIQRMWKAFQIWRIDHQYVTLNRHLDWYENALKDAQSGAQIQRVALMIRRQKLRNEMKRLGGH